jgi:peptidoglycan/xylan/chitin deacetylase (PgdA/CDA1 family)
MNEVLVLCYHAVSERWPAALAVTPEHLEEQLSSLVRRGYAGARFTDAVHAPAGRRTLAVTFDDAFRSVLELAAPVLASLGLPGTVFVPTAFPGAGRPLRWPGIDGWAGGEHSGELACLDWDELDALAGAGWEIASHTVSHPRLTQLDDGALDRELTLSRLELEERLQRPCRSIAYPYGEVDERVTAAARRAGYSAGAGLLPTPRGAGPLRFPRVGVYRRDDERRFRLKTSRAVRRLRAGRPLRATADWPVGGTAGGDAPPAVAGTAGEAAPPAVPGTAGGAAPPAGPGTAGGATPAGATGSAGASGVA